MNYRLAASEMANRMLHAGATVGDLRRAVTHEMMMAVGMKAAKYLAGQRHARDNGVKSSYREPRKSAQWAVCVKHDLTVDSIEIETWILDLKTIVLVDKHDRAPVAPFSVTGVMALDPMATTTYKSQGAFGGFPIVFEV